jgi:hypothetical protein
MSITSIEEDSCAESLAQIKGLPWSDSCAGRQHANPSLGDGPFETGDDESFLLNQYG